MSDNGSVTATDLQIGVNGGTGVVTVGGTGTAVLNADMLHMNAQCYSGVLTVNAGGSVTIGGSADHMVVGDTNPGWPGGTINVTGGVFHRLPGFDSYYGGDWRIGLAGYGALNVSGGLYLDEGLVYIGEVGTGVMSVTGGTVSMPAGLTIGSVGVGNASISGAGLVSTSLSHAWHCRAATARWPSTAAPCRR